MPDTPSSLRTVEVVPGGAGAAPSPYRIEIRSGLLATLHQRLLEDFPDAGFAVVGDLNTGPLYGRPLAERLRAAGARAYAMEIIAGEDSKNLASFEALLVGLMRRGFSRRDVTVAVGGGVVGDMAGFAAGCYMRGMAYVQAPTSLLAQVDASVGGKTAVNLGEAKNYVGLFHQPSLVAIDLDTLATLPTAELLNGAAEVVKYGVIADAALFTFLEQQRGALLALDPDVLAHVVERCCQLKAEVVAEDATERGRRIILNYGHTFGHAIEDASRLAIAHGEAVAYGMRMAGRLAVALNMWSARDALRQETLLNELGLAVKPLEGLLPPGRAAEALTPENILTLMGKDKKAHAGSMALVLPTGIGRAEVRRDVDKAQVLAAIEAVHRHGGA